MRSWISEKSIHFWIVRKRDVEEMIEIVKKHFNSGWDGNNRLCNYMFCN